MDTRPKEKVVSGWLRRKGRRLKTWSRRWCILTDKFLFIFLRDDDSKFQDCLTLNEQIIAEPPLDPDDPQHGGYFDIITEHDDGHTETLSLCAETEEEKKVWIRALNRVLYAEKGGALFSQSLEEILYWERMAGRHIPYIVNQCVEYLYKRGLDVEGIFRLPGRQTAAKDIIARFERGHKINFEDEGTDVHVVASVLKTFLRSLPDSIIPCKFFQKFMNISLCFTNEKDETSRQALVQELAEAMKLIPKDNYTILKYICRFLQEVGRHEPTNKMSFESLGTVFGYNILRHIDNENSQLFLLTADLGQNLIYMLLKYYTQVFLLEYKSEEDKKNMKRRKGLLRMSQTVDIPTALPVVSVTSSGLVDHEELDLTTGLPMWSKTGCSTPVNNADNHLLSVENSRIEIEFDGGATGDYSVVRRVNKTLTEEKRSLHLSLSEYDAEVACLTENAKSTNSYSSSSVKSTSLSPRRANTRLVRSRYLSDRRRPESAMLGTGERFHRDLHSPGGVNSDDVFLALAMANTSAQNSVTTSAPLASWDEFFTQDSYFTSAPSNSFASLDDDCACIDPTLECFTSLSSKTVTESVITQQKKHKTDSSLSEQTLNISLQLKSKETKEEPNIIDLKNQISVLKEQLAQQRNSHRIEVATLQAQLSHMKENYERKIQTVQNDYRLRKIELENKLSEIKQSHTLAVAESASLEESIHTYKMLFGDLS